MPLTQVGKWNKIPKEMMPELPADGTVVSFRITNEFIIEPDGEKRLPMSYIFPTTSSFIDPKTNEVIPICIIDSTNDKGEINSVHKIRFSPQRSAGHYNITIGSSAEANDEYRYLMLCSELAGNENAVFGAEVKFELVNVRQNAERSRQERQRQFGAINHAMALKDNELTDIALILGINPDGDILQIRDLIETYAENNPKDYMKKVQDEDGVYIALINNAMRLDVVYNNNGTIRWRIGDVKIFDLSANENLLIPEEFVNYVKREKSAAVMVEKLKEYVGKANAKKSAGKGKKAQASEE